MEGLIGLLILGFCVWMILRHPLKSLSFLFKGGFLLVLGLGAFLVLGAGFAHPDIIHNATHDTRHAFTFPCH